jgi:peptide/nickel transport system permease protein
MRLGTYLLRRLLWAVPTLVGITLVTFLMTRFAPGDPATARLEDSTAVRITPSEHARLRAYLELDRPVVVQYGRWLWRAVRLDFGRSWSSGRRVSDQIGERLPPTLAVAGAALLASLLVAIPAGLACAARAGGRFDRASGVICSGLYALPSYAAALALVAVVSVKLDWLPSSGRRSLNFDEFSAWGQFLDVVRHGVLITFSLAYPWTAYQIRFVRNHALEALGAPFVAAARAKGMSEWAVMMRHVLRHTSVALVTLVALVFPALLSGAVVLEYIFSWPGIGSLFVDSLFRRDYPVVMGLTVVTASAVLAANMVADALYALLDPRVRYD